jgi:hypothetical protein
MPEKMKRRKRSRSPPSALVLASLLTLPLSPAGASPFISPGDMGLRHDIQLLADYGVIRGPTTSWPLAWGPIIADIEDPEGEYMLNSLPPQAADALSKVRERASSQWQALIRHGELNRGGAEDARSSLTATKQDLLSFDVSYRRLFRYGVVEMGAGIERIEDAVSQEADNSLRALYRWCSAQ